MGKEIDDSSVVYVYGSKMAIYVGTGKCLHDSSFELFIDCVSFGKETVILHRQTTVFTCIAAIISNHQDPKSHQNIHTSPDFQGFWVTQKLLGADYQQKYYFSFHHQFLRP
ncbi:hypothetical protein RJT34_10970 [Clitoria ternatea]|uniref:Uncharacterized protein n=1 Tax=Clitoria ternatea TaxID=43366 RepID=A0AAN9JJ22_CLITE